MFPRVLAEIIFGYAEPWKLRDWIPLDKVDRRSLWGNPRGLDLCEQLRLEINWRWLSRNPHPWALAQLRANPRLASECGLEDNPGLTKADLARWPCLTAAEGFL